MPSTTRCTRGVAKQLPRNAEGVPALHEEFVGHRVTKAMRMYPLLDASPTGIATSISRTMDLDILRHFWEQNSGTPSGGARRSLRALTHCSMSGEAPGSMPTVLRRSPFPWSTAMAPMWRSTSLGSRESASLTRSPERYITVMRARSLMPGVVSAHSSRMASSSSGVRISAGSVSPLWAGVFPLPAPGNAPAVLMETPYAACMTLPESYAIQ